VTGKDLDRNVIGFNRSQRKITRIKLLVTFLSLHNTLPLLTKTFCTKGQKVSYQKHRSEWPLALVADWLLVAVSARYHFIIYSPTLLCFQSGFFYSKEQCWRWRSMAESQNPAIPYTLWRRYIGLSHHISRN